MLQWDKEDCADAGLVKFDLLSLGMLTALRIAFDELGDGSGRGDHHPPLRGWASRDLNGVGGASARPAHASLGGSSRL